MQVDRCGDRSHFSGASWISRPRNNGDFFFGSNQPRHQHRHQDQQRQEDEHTPHAVERKVESLGNQWWHLSFPNSSKSRDYLINLIFRTIFWTILQISCLEVRFFEGFSTTSGDPAMFSLYCAPAARW
jgi:hypothetical protein